MGLYVPLDVIVHVVALCSTLCTLCLGIHCCIREHRRRRAAPTAAVPSLVPPPPVAPCSRRDLEILPVVSFPHWCVARATAAGCSICLEDYGSGEHLRLLWCGHVFHRHCIDEWLTKRSAICPICRSKVVKVVAAGAVGGGVDNCIGVAPR